MVIPLHWHNEPLLLLSLLLLGWFYAVGAGPMRPNIAPAGTPFPTAKAVSFYAGLILNYLAVGSPLDQFGEDYLFSVHMIQHNLITYLTPPLMLWGMPWWLADAVLSRRGIKSLAKLCLHPALACTAFPVTFCLWHIPEFYEIALRNRSVHILEHLIMFFTATSMWWIFFGPSRIFPPSKPHLYIVCAFFLAVANMPIIGLLAFPSDPIYPTYAFAPRIIPGFSALDDQVTGGVIMQVIGISVALGQLAWGFWSWSREDKRAKPVSPQ